MGSRSGSRYVKAVGAVGTLAVAVAACGGQGSGNSANGGGSQSGSLTIGSFSTYTGPNASLGPEQIAGCYTAASLINKAGGVLGHQTPSQALNARGGPADRGAPATQALATTSHFGRGGAPAAPWPGSGLLTRAGS